MNTWTVPETQLAGIGDTAVADVVTNLSDEASNEGELQT